MPALYWIFGGIASTVSGLLGFHVGGGFSGLSRIVLFGGLGFTSYVIAKYFKVI
tara:strand:+ start:12389 stop:12550 length:162 start_codon:yes stop_codon:yes gene_type:complete